MIRYIERATHKHIANRIDIDVDSNPGSDSFSHPVYKKSMEENSRTIND